MDVRWLLGVLVSGLLWIFLLEGCRKDDDFITMDANFSISQDTLLFDTVFTTVGSATHILKIYNKESNPIKVDVGLRSGANSFFRLNVDGYQGKTLQDIEINANDSVYAFIEVTIDPDDPLSVSPYVIEDALVVSQGGSMEEALLIAWGQNANYISNKGAIARLACNNSTFRLDDAKPYVIYGILVVDSCELVIPAGANIHVHGGLIVNPDAIYNDGMIIIYTDGKLTVEGTIDNPVNFEGSRLEPYLDQDPGQWVGLRFWAGSKGNTIRNARIKNSIIGIIADSASQVSLYNTEIRNTLSASIRGVHADIYGENLLLFNAGSNPVSLSYGGTYEFNYSTIANSSSQSVAVSIDNRQCEDLDNDPFCLELVSINKPSLRMSNCILYGPNDDELAFFNHPKSNEEDYLDFEFNNCIIKVDELLDAEAFPNFFDNCQDCINLKRDDILFRNLREDDYRLDTMSVGEMQGLPINGINVDIIGLQRDGSNPDIGCFEFEG